MHRHKESFNAVVVICPEVTEYTLKPLYAIIGYDAHALWLVWGGYTRYLTELCTEYGPDPLAILPHDFMQAVSSEHLYGMLPPDILESCYQNLTREIWSSIEPMFDLMEDHNTMIRRVAGYWTRPDLVPTPPVLIFCNTPANYIDDHTPIPSRLDQRNAYTPNS